MEINVVGRHMDVPDRFRRHLEEKLEKVPQLAPTALRVDVELSHENNPRQVEMCDRVELTVHDNGRVIRSEASASDLFGALDIAYGKLLERLRRTRDRRKDHRRGRDKTHQAQTESVRTMEALSTSPLPSDLSAPPEDDAEAHQDAVASAETEPDSPVVIREKKHEAAPMTIDDALYEMELVGHDFYLFRCADTNNPKVVYRRKGWNYGVIELEEKSA